MQLVLHIGMHKTASTTIQKRLKANDRLLQEHGYFYVDKQRKKLLKAALNRSFKPWRELIEQAAATGLTPVVSHEAFSHVLCRSRSKSTTTCLGDWLLKKLGKAGIKVTVIGFIRDQPSYLNSHYTQHVKRFITSQSFGDYAAAAMGPAIQKNSCDPERLFGWLAHHPSVRTVLFPYGRSITPPACLQQAPREPFAQFIHCLGIPDSVAFHAVENMNSQPGDLAIRTALHLNQAFQREGIHLGKKAKRARALLCREAEQRNWGQTPYVGLDSTLNQRIRDCFAAANNRFAQRIWGCSWDQIFPESPIAEPRSPSTAEQQEIQQAAEVIRRRLFPQPSWLKTVLRPLLGPGERC